jgi:hypothetical protein
MIAGDRDQPGSHLALGELLDYWLGEAEPAENDRIETHVFECDTCAEGLEGARKLGAALITLLRTGRISARATTGLVNRFARDRLNVRQYSVRPGEVVQCTVSPHDDLLLTRFILPDVAPNRIDVAVRDDDGRELGRYRDVTIDRGTNEVLSFLPAGPRQADPSGRLHYVLLAPESGDRELGTYTLEHTAMNEA